MNEKEISFQTKESIRFLESDFNQCFEQVRYYDAQVVNIFKFLATFYTTIAGLALGIYKFCLEKNIDLTIALVVGLVIGLIFGILMFFLVVRNRVYFVCCMRYVNEQRKLFLSFKPLGFENKSGMYTNYSQPPFFNWLSSQSCWMYLIALLNAFLLGVILYLGKQKMCIIIIWTGLLFLVQLLFGIIYLCTRENKSTSKAVFGK